MVYVLVRERERERERDRQTERETHTERGVWLWLQTLLKQGLLPTIIRTMLAIMATPREMEEEGEEVSTESQSPISLAAQVMMSSIILSPWQPNR